MTTWANVRSQNRRDGKQCPTCGRKPKRGRKTCKRCLKQAADRRRRWRANGLCVGCRVASKTRWCRACRPLAASKPPKPIVAFIARAPWPKLEQSVRYEPLDEIVEAPSVRVLRAARWFDWITLSDLMAALDVGPEDQARSESMRAVAYRLRRAGHLERRGHSYRITPAGRAKLKARIESYDQSVIEDVPANRALLAEKLRAA